MAFRAEHSDQIAVEPEKERGQAGGGVRFGGAPHPISNPPGPHVFVSERGGPVTTAWFRKMMARLGEGLACRLIHPHMLRHSCGF